MRSELFNSANQEKQSQERWTLQSSKMLRALVAPGQDILATKGAMVAYQGDVTFKHEGAGSLGKLFKAMASSDNAPLMRVAGQGDVFFAKQAHNIFTMLLENDAITVNGANLLAFDGSINWDIKMLKGGGFMAGGLFNTTLTGQGVVALTCDGDPMILDASQQPTYVDPQAAVCWSNNLVPSIKNDLKLGSLVRGGSGESFQLAFHGPGFVVVQPSEGVPVVAGS